MKLDNMNLNKNILHNKYLLYLIFFLSFGNFIIEMMNGNMYFVAVYILIGVLTSFFNKNMIVILSIAVIFTNILKYGRATTFEGFDGEEIDENDIEQIFNPDTSRDGEVIDAIVDGSESKKKSKHKLSSPDSDLEEDDDDDEDDDEQSTHVKKKKKKEGLKRYTDEDLDNMDYEKTEQLIKNQKQILKNMREYKPFLDTIQGLTKHFSGMVSDD
jgi:hypothetical protein